MFTPPSKNLISSFNEKLNLSVGLKVFLAIEGVLGVGIVLAAFITGVKPLQVAERQWAQYMLEGQEKAAFHYLCSKGRKDFCTRERTIGDFLSFMR